MPRRECRSEGCRSEAMWCGLCNAHCDGTDEHGEYRPDDEDEDRWHRSADEGAE